MKDFLSFVRRPTDLLKSLRRITVGGLIAAAGTGVGTPTTATELPKPAAPEAVSPTIVDRSRKAAKLVLQLPGAVGLMSAEHRSHRSHSSHRSHVSSSGGGAPAPAPPRTTTPPPRTAPVREAPGTASAVDLTTPTSLANAVAGEVVAINIDARTITVRETPTTTTRRTFTYRDDTKFQAMAGVTFRFDDFADANAGRLPIATGDKVEIQWRTSADGKTQIVSTVLKKQ